MTYTTQQIREFCDAFDRGELERRDSWDRWIKADNDKGYLHYALTIGYRPHDNTENLRITPKPVPPVYEQWTDIKEVPLEHWYIRTITTPTRWRISGIDTFEKRVCICGIWIPLDELKNHFLHSPDPFAPDSEWMVCGRVKR